MILCNPLSRFPLYGVEAGGLDTNMKAHRVSFTGANGANGANEAGVSVTSVLSCSTIAA